MYSPTQSGKLLARRRLLQSPFPCVPDFQWNIGRRSLPLGERTLIMGVLNVTPDSFSDGGRFSRPKSAIAHGLALLDEGADILDIGGESTRPGASTASSQTPSLARAVSAQEEIDRVLPVIQAILQQRPHAVLSIDTYKSTVARSALEAGAEIVNDVSGFTWDSAVAATIAAHPCGSILMHVRGLPHQWRTPPPVPDIVSLVSEELRERAAAALDAGIARTSIVLDPGFGFGKTSTRTILCSPALPSFTLSAFPCLPQSHAKAFSATPSPPVSANSPVLVPHICRSQQMWDCSPFRPPPETPPPLPPRLPLPSPELTSSACTPFAPPSKPLPSPTPSLNPLEPETLPLNFPLLWISSLCTLQSATV